MTEVVPAVRARIEIPDEMMAELPYPYIYRWERRLRRWTHDGRIDVARHRDLAKCVTVFMGRVYPSGQRLVGCTMRALERWRMERGYLDR